jgi:exopolyphosphatase / guanosine-5'-triphosphate,3'-diphosphate pyrophosphatase
VSIEEGLDVRPLRYKPVAVVDIGSNSVRLVVYDGLRRSPTPLFNEKLLCALGKGVALTGLISEQSVTRALAALRRFRALCRQLGAEHIYAVATAAAREAKNGPDFVARAQKALGAEIDILSGKQEARFAALGVMAGIPDADGVVGDLGGGSLELIDVRDSAIRDGFTLPIGPLRLIDLSGGSMKEARRIVDKALLSTRLIENLRGRDFYAVGGAWRNLGKLHMAQNRYPLHVLHQYRINPEAARSVADLVSGLSPASLKDVRTVSRSRSDTLPYGAMVLERLLSLSKARGVVISVFGVREGLLFSKLKESKRRTDVLLSACWDLTRRYARSPQHELELSEWTDALFESTGKKSTPGERRLRHAACLLADIGWQAHPDYRGSRSLTIISQAAFVGVDHPGRIFLALAVFYRYEGPDSDAAPREFIRLIDDESLYRARVISAVMRLAYVLSAAMPGLLPKIKLVQAPGKTLLLTIPKKHADLMGERVTKRLAELSDLMGLSPKTTIS